ncbi:hypothetical protein BD779DRAFT_1117865 [Infundibulicybe gibba]|nr:hypothetical protein BD779DRAFT_1117865 [Infundibulicybe gibba]
MASISSHPHTNSIASTDEFTTTPACVLVLVNQDILQLIFRHFRTSIDLDDTTKSKNKLSLFRAALTCKAFVEPALDSLWWSMTSLMPVLKLLQNFQMVEDMADTYTFCDNFSDQDLARFDYHSRRVREFHYHTVPAQQIGATALVRLAQYRPIIYPHLQKVVWSTALSPSTLFLISPTLKSLDVQNSLDDPSIMITFISAVLNNLPQSLISIALRGSISATCLALVPQMRSLSTVIIPDLGASGSATFLCQLGALDGLENLHINLQGPATKLLTPSDHISFPALRVLSVSGQLDLICDFVITVASKQVVSISVSSKHAGKPAAPRERGEMEHKITTNWVLPRPRFLGSILLDCYPLAPHLTVGL